MAKVLCIDHDSIMRLVLSDHLNDIGHDVLEAKNDLDGVNILLKEDIDIIVADARTLRKSNSEVLMFLKNHSKTVPLVSYSNQETTDSIMIDSHIGSYSHINSPISDIKALKKVIERHLGVTCIQSSDAPRIPFASGMCIEHKMTTHIPVDSHLTQPHQSHTIFSACAQALNGALKEKAPATANHHECVSQIAMQMATAMGLRDEHRKALELAGLVLDIGKIATPRAILNKNGPLTSDEVEIVRDHVDCGVRILRSISFPAQVTEAVLQHHERFDGTGYPKRLSGERILLESRILAVADVYNALCPDRPYRGRLCPSDACDFISNNAGTLFCPSCVEAFAKSFMS